MRQPREKYDKNSYRRAIQRACDKANVERWAPNQLRHLAATEIRAEFGLEGAQLIQGHASGNTTQIYAELNLQRGKEIARKVG